MSSIGFAQRLPLLALFLALASPCGAAGRISAGDSTQVTVTSANMGTGIAATCDWKGRRFTIQAQVVDDQVISVVRNDLGVQITKLTLPAFDNRPIDTVADFGSYYVAAIEQAARELGSTQSSLEYENAYEDDLAALWRETQFLGNTAMRQSLLMHISVLNVLKAAAVSGTIRATLCPKSDGVRIPFHCGEDHGDLKPEWISVGGTGTFFCGGLKGADCGCCGNYSGFCYYCDVLCLAHDIACQTCFYWWCLWDCVPGPCATDALVLNGRSPSRPVVSIRPSVAQPARGDVGGAPARASTPAPLADVELASPFPNPSSSGVTIQFVLAQAGESHLRVYNISGSTVRTLAGGPVGPGVHVVRWDRTTDTGSRARPGVYFVELRIGSVRLERRIVVLQ